MELAMTDSLLDGTLLIPRPIVGWRLFRADARGRLVSLNALRGPYEIGQWHEAECTFLKIYMDYWPHNVPHPDCRCGFYAFPDRQGLFRESFDVDEIIVEKCWAAKVQLAGRVITHEEGYRAQRMKIVGAWPLRRWLDRISPALGRRPSEERT